MKKILIGTLLAFSLTNALFAAQTTVHSGWGSLLIAPYAGRLDHSYKNDTYKLDMDDHGAMYGLFGQFNSRFFMANAFGWYCPEVNEARVKGLHSNIDFRTAPIANTYFVLGGIYENIDIKMASKELAGTAVNDFSMHTDVSEFMGRLGIAITSRMESDHPRSLFDFYITVMPYGGGGREYQKVNVNIDFIPFYIPDQNVASDDHEDFMFVGLNFSITAFKMLSLSAKYRADYMDAGRRDTWDCGATLMFMPNAGLTYKFKLMEISDQKISYHLGGIVVRI